MGECPLGRGSANALRSCISHRGLTAARHKVVEALGADAGSTMSGALPFTPRARRALERAGRVLAQGARTTGQRRARPARRARRQRAGLSGAARLGLDTAPASAANTPRPTPGEVALIATWSRSRAAHHDGADSWSPAASRRAPIRRIWRAPWPAVDPSAQVNLCPPLVSLEHGAALLCSRCGALFARFAYFGEVTGDL